MPEEEHREDIREGVMMADSESQHRQIEFGPVHMTEEERGIFFDKFIRNLETKFGSVPITKEEHRELNRGGIRKYSLKEFKNKRNRRILERKFTFRFRRSGGNIKLRFNLRTYKK